MHEDSSSFATFAYTVFGGSARMAKLINAHHVQGDRELVRVVQVELLEYFEDSEFADSLLFLKFARLIASQISQICVSDNQAQAQLVEHSLFKHNYKGEMGFASTFMSILAGVLVENDQLKILTHLRDILTNSAMDVVFEAQVHKMLYQKFKDGFELRLTCLYPADTQRKAGQGDLQTLSMTVECKVFIRTLDDIAKLDVNVYGLPIVPNFVLVDAVITSSLRASRRAESSCK